MQTSSPLLAPVLPQQSATGQPYLRFQLGPQMTSVLSMQHAQEVLVLPVQRITPMPNMPTAVLGLFNWRSRVIWVVDLARMLQLAPLEANLQRYNLIIIRVGSLPLGLVVQQVEGVIRLAPETIQSPLGAVASGLVPFLQGCVLEQQEVLLVLDAEAIVRSPAICSSANS